MLRMLELWILEKLKMFLYNNLSPQNLHSLLSFKQNPNHLSGVFATLGQNKDFPQGTIIKIAKMLKMLTY